MRNGGTGKAGDPGEVGIFDGEVSWRSTALPTILESRQMGKVLRNA